jgi:hypothetical protein
VIEGIRVKETRKLLIQKVEFKREEVLDHNYAVGG